MITVVGMDGSPLSAQAGAALRSATLVVGGRRHIAALPVLAAAPSVPGGLAAPSSLAATRARPGSGAGDAAEVGQQGADVRTVVLGELAPALDALAAHDGDAVVLASGDPGFFGIVRALRERGLTAVVLPAVSSVALAFARAGLPWDDSVVVSAHGRDLRPAVNVCRAHPKVAVLTGPGAGPAEIAAALAGWDRRLVVGERLGSRDEQITECSPASAASRAWTDPNVVLVLADASPAPPSATSASRIPAAPAPGPGSPPERLPAPTPGHGPGWVWPPPVTLGDGWALGEEQFDSREAVITKAEVRALALARLAPAPGTLVWDVGAGSGSVGVECARFGAAVIAVERDARRCDRIRANAQRHAVDVRTVQGEAPHALDGLPPPDAVFVGGGGHAVIEAVAGRRPARIVVALAAVERAGAALATLAAAGYAPDGVLLHAARFAPLPGDVHRLAATNPVFLVWGTASRGAPS
jgi:precorrin-6Y C5,15-methyltransferase (decarboxylating)